VTRCVAPVSASPGRPAALAAWQSGHGAMQARATRNGERQRFRGVAAKVLA